ncbi:MAG: dihydrodipicolinate synthase family protein [Pyrinomonadaceae bacterium]
MTFALHGVIPAMVTPRDDIKDDIDLERLKRLTRTLLDAGCHGLFPTSSTGEAALLSPSHRRAAIEAVDEVADGTVPILASVGAASTIESIMLAVDVEHAGATHLAILPTHFVPLSADELYGYFAAVADSAGVPSILYNYVNRDGSENLDERNSMPLKQLSVAFAD